MACYIQTFVFIGILVPLTWYLVFPMGMGSTGIFQGVLGSTVVTIILLSLRFYWLYRRDLREEIQTIRAIFQEKINKLKKDRGAIILGHNYMEPALFILCPTS